MPRMSAPDAVDGSSIGASAPRKWVLLIRGGHYGQRSCEPHSKAEHMAAPTSCIREESSCQLGAVHTWPLVEVSAVPLDVCLARRSGLKLDVGCSRCPEQEFEMSEGRSS